jgi:hypothetical protein
MCSEQTVSEMVVQHVREFRLQESTEKRGKEGDGKAGQVKRLDQAAGGFAVGVKRESTMS